MLFVNRSIIAFAKNCSIHTGSHRSTMLRTRAAAWRVDYNTNHPHNSLDDLTPQEFAKRTANNMHQAVFSGAPVG